MRVLFFGTYDAQRHPRIGVLRQGFMQLGAEVVELNKPIGFDTATRVKMLRQPWRPPLALARLLRRWFWLWKQARRIGQVDVIVVGYLGHFDVHLARRLWRDRPLVLDYLISMRATAIDRAIRNRFVLRVLGWIDDMALGCADIVVLDTEEHRSLLPPDGHAKSLVIHVGAQEDWFLEPRRKTTGIPSVIFFGLFTPLQGAPVIGVAIKLLSDRGVFPRFILVGTGQDYDATRRAVGSADNVRWVDWLDPAELRRTVSSSDICLGIFGITDKGRRVVPNKLFQGAAAGCALVTSRTPPQERLFDGVAIFVPPGDAVALADRIESLVADHARLANLQRESRALAERDFTPAAVTKPLAHRLREL